MKVRTVLKPHEYGCMCQEVTDDTAIVVFYEGYSRVEFLSDIEFIYDRTKDEDFWAQVLWAKKNGVPYKAATCYANEFLQTPYDPCWFRVREYFENE